MFPDFRTIAYLMEDSMELVLEKYDPVLAFTGTEEEQSEIEEKQERNDNRIMSMLAALHEGRLEWIMVHNGHVLKVITRGFNTPYRCSTFVKYGNMESWEASSHFDYQEKESMIHGYNHVGFTGRIFYK